MKYSRWLNSKHAYRGTLIAFLIGITATLLPIPSWELISPLPFFGITFTFAVALAGFDDHTINHSLGNRRARRGVAKHRLFSISWLRMTGLELYFERLVKLSLQSCRSGSVSSVSASGHIPYQRRRRRNKHAHATR